MKLMTPLIFLASLSLTSLGVNSALAVTESPIKEPIAIEAPENRIFTSEQKPSLDRCFDMADHQNKEILVAAAGLPIAQAAIVIAKAIPNPTYNLLYGWGPAFAYVIAGNDQQFGWTEEIQVAGRRTKKTNVARSNLLQQALQLEALRFDVHNRTRRAYAEQSAAQAYLDLTDAQVGIVRQLYEISSKRYRAGKAPGQEVLQSKLALMQLEAQRNSAQGRLVQDTAQLELLLGETPRTQEVIQVDSNALFKLSAEKNEIVPDLQKGLPAIDQLLPTAWANRSDLKAAIQKAWADRKALTLAKTQRIPDPSVGFNYFFSTLKPYQQQYFTPVHEAQKVPYQPGYMVSVQEETPIFYQYQGQVKQAKSNWQQQIKQNELTGATIANSVVQAYESLQVTQENIRKFQTELLPAAQKMAQLSRRGYEMGQTDLATAILAQQAYQQMRSSYFDSIVAHQNAWADMEQALGVPIKL